MNKTFLLVLFCLIGGCARVTLLTSSDIVAEVELAQQQHDYNRAWYYLNNIRETHPQYDQVPALRERLEASTANFEQTEISNARSLASAGRWPQAFATLKQAQQQWRQSEPLQQEEKALRERETLLFNRLRTDLLVDEARWLASRQDTIRQLSTLDRSDALAMKSYLEQRKLELVDTLNFLGEAFAAQEDWPRTRDLLNASMQLSGEKTAPPALVTARQHLSQLASKNRQVREQKVQNQALELLNRYDQSLALKDLLAAREYISANNNSGQLDQYASRLEAICKQRFRQGLSEGEALYAQGKYEQAYDTWQGIAQIYPGDAELEKKIDRARKVLTNLKALSGS